MPLVLRAVKGSKISIAEMDANLTYLESIAGGSAAPVALTASTTLTEASHANRDINTTAAAAVTHTLPATATTGARFYGTNLGAGVLSIVLDGGGAVPRNALLPTTIDQYSAWEVRRTATGYVRIA